MDGEQCTNYKQVPMVTRPHSPWLAHTQAEREAGEMKTGMLGKKRDGEQLQIVYSGYCSCSHLIEYLHFFNNLEPEEMLQDPSVSFPPKNLCELLRADLSGSFPWLPGAHTAPDSSTPPPTSAFKSCSSTASVHLTFT